MLPGCPGAADKIRVQYCRPYPRQHKLIHPLRGGRRAPPGRSFTTRSLGTSRLQNPRREAHLDENGYRSLRRDTRCPVTRIPARFDGCELAGRF